MSYSTSHGQPARTRTVLIGTVAAIALLGASGAAYRSSHAGSPAPVAAAAVPVGVRTVHAETVRLWSTFSGRTHAVDYAEIRPEVSGRITEIRFTEGQMVKAGDVLFVIDPAPYQAAVAKAEANLASSVSAAAFAKAQRERATELLPRQNIAASVYDQRANDERVANAAVQSAGAQLKQARIDLDRAHVKAPISGRVSRAELTVGNLVEIALGVPVLTSIASTDGIYVDFEVDEQTYMDSIRANADTPDKERRIPVEISVHGDAAHAYRGTIRSFDNHIDTASGTIRARAEFANEDGALVPGMFVAVKLASSRDVEAVLVPERAVSTDQSKKFVYVVGDDNKVAYRETVLGEKVGSDRVVVSGLHAGDRVVIDGLQHVRPDVAVQAKEVADKRETDVAAN